MSEKNEENTIETLNINEEIKDLPKSKFRSILEINKQQEEMLNAYNKEHNNSDIKIPDLSNDVRILEKKLAAKKNSVSIKIVVLIIIIINVLWILGLKFLILPKYEDCVKQNNEIKENYEELKSKVNVLVGE